MYRGLLDGHAKNVNMIESAWADDDYMLSNKLSPGVVFSEYNVEC